MLIEIAPLFITLILDHPNQSGDDILGPEHDVVEVLILIEDLVTLSNNCERKQFYGKKAECPVLCTEMNGYRGLGAEPP